MKSMTAFSRQDDTQSEFELSWELRSVNHRFLDISLHLPEAFSSYENEFKEQIQNSLGRGKFDAKLTYKKPFSTTGEQLHLNEEKLESLIKTRQKLESLTKMPMELSVMEILNWPGIINKTESENTQHITEVSSLLKKALIGLVKMRGLEGERLSDLILTRCKTVVEIVQSVRTRRIEVQKALRERVLKKILEIDVEVDNNRLEQELVYQAQRLDVDEELDRLDAHIQEVMMVLKRDEPVGRRLDFLMQELNREANTLASKSNDAETTKSAVELKVLIEQMREQVMNIE